MKKSKLILTIFALLAFLVGYQVFAATGSGNITITVGSGIPSSPAWLTATPGSCGTTYVDLSWASSTYATSYRVQSWGADIYNGASTSFQHTGLTPGSNHEYRVRAENVSGVSAWSVTQTVNAPIACANVDLSAGTVSPSSTTINSPTTFSSTISNGGTTGTLISFSNFFQVNNGSNGSGGTTTDLTSSSMAALGAGASNNANSPSYTFTAAGSYSVRACADKTNSASAGVITETNESNNCSGWTNITISPQIIYVALDTSVSGPGSNSCWAPGDDAPFGQQTGIFYDGAVVETTGATFYNSMSDYNNNIPLDVTGRNLKLKYTIWQNPQPNSGGGIPFTTTYTPILSGASSFVTNVWIEYYQQGQYVPEDCEWTWYGSHGDVEVLDGLSETVPYQLIPMPPTANVVAPAGAYQNQTFNVQWSSDGATSCTGTNFNTNGAISGSVPVTQSGVTTYTVTCDNIAGSSSDATTVIDYGPPLPEITWVNGYLAQVQGEYWIICDAQTAAPYGSYQSISIQANIQPGGFNLTCGANIQPGDTGGSGDNAGVDPNSFWVSDVCVPNPINPLGPGVNQC